MNTHPLCVPLGCLRFPLCVKECAELKVPKPPQTRCDQCGTVAAEFICHICKADKRRK